MKKTIAALVLLAALGACGDDSPTGRPNDNPNDPWTNVGYGDQVRTVEIDGVTCVLYRADRSTGGRAMDCDFQHEGTGGQ